MTNQDYSQYGSAIAVVGMTGRFPGAGTLEAFWQNLRNGVESISFFSDEELVAAGIPAELLQQPNYVKALGVLEGVETFDASFFGFSPREAEVMDPQHRLFLECAWHVLEDAGCDPDRFAGRIGVYAGVGTNTYALSNLFSNPRVLAKIGGFQAIIANDKDFLSTRVSYKLNLKGPSLSVQTACSTSLVAVHLACQSLLYRECDAALAGGVSLSLPQTGYLYREGMVASPDGHCRAFDVKARGFVSGNGVGIVLLKRLPEAVAEGDHIYAVIRGSAINNDGACKVGYTAPSVEGQAEVIAEALALAEVEPETIRYVETHGTATPLGDGVEIAALTQAFQAQTEKRGFCAIGSVKTNIGHLDTAAGVTGLIKTVLALQHQEIPASLHFEQANPELDLPHSPFYVNTALSEWKSAGAPRRAGVSSFGLGGTNAHVVLEEAPRLEPTGPSRRWQVLLLSAKTPSALETATANLVRHLRQVPEPNLADVAYTLQVGRQAFKHRRALVCSDGASAITALETLNPEQVRTSVCVPQGRPVTFMFPGLGDQYPNMTLELYQTEPIFRATVERCCDFLKAELNLDLRTVLFPGGLTAQPELAAESPSSPKPDLRRLLARSPEPAVDPAMERLSQTAVAHPAVFVVEYALAQLLGEWGMRPHALIGHSLGEYVAACLAGVFSLEEGLTLVSRRARLIQALPTGAMLAVLLPEEKVQPFLSSSLSLSAVNGPSLCVVAGPDAAVVELERTLTEQGIACRRVPTVHAFHSAMLDPIVEPLAELVKTFKLKPPTIPYISNLTGTWITPEQATDPQYWAQHSRHPVRFAAGVRELWQEPARVFLEVGPGRTLCSLVSQQAKQPGERVVLSSLPHSRDRVTEAAFLLNTLAQLWLAGVPIDWAGYTAHERRRRLSLPVYPFERQRYWVEAQTPVASASPGPAEALPAGAGPDRSEGLSQYQRPNMSTAYVAPQNELETAVAVIWQELLGIEPIGIHDDFYTLGGHSLLATRVISRLKEVFPIELPLRDLFAALTIAQMAEVLERALLEQVQQLSDDEIQRQLGATLN